MSNLVSKRDTSLGVVVGVLAFGAGAFFLGVFLVQVLWNAVVPRIMGFGSLSYWDAAMLFILVSILFVRIGVGTKK